MTATSSAADPFVFNNDALDGSLGITSKIFLDQVSPEGHQFDSLEVPSSADPGSGRTATSWSRASPRSPSWRSTSRRTTGM